MSADPVLSPSFWPTIERARKAAPSDSEEFCEAVKRERSTLPEDQIIAFQHDLDVLMNRMYHWDLWAAAYIMNGGCSDDGFEYWRCWLIAQGQKICEAAMENPESLASNKLRYGEPGMYECESLLYVPVQALQAKTDKEMPRPAARQPAEPAGERWEEDGDELERRHPKLWKKFAE